MPDRPIVVREDLKKFTIASFEYSGFTIVDANTLSNEDRNNVLTSILSSLESVPAEVMCTAGNNLLEECRGEVRGIVLAFFLNGERIFEFSLHGMRIISETRRVITVSTRFLPGFRDLRGAAFGEFSANFLDHLLRNNLKMSDGRELNINTVKYDTFSLSRGGGDELSDSFDDSISSRSGTLTKTSEEDSEFPDRFKNTLRLR